MSDKHPPQTLAIDEDPWDSVIKDSTRIEYGKSSSDGKVGTNALFKQLKNHD